MIVTGKTQTEVNKLANSYNSLAKEMNVTTRELAGQAADLFRQGLDNSQVEERMKVIIQYAKISSISLEESNRIITATANATGESVQKITDIFAFLGDTTASGADEIGESLQRVASASENSNITLEKSASWLATISSITRESASTIGRSLNSAISRYESIKNTGFNSEDETKLNDVVEALDEVKIKATDSEGQLRDFGDVMDELGGKFQTLSKNEKAYITTVLFGTFQRNRGLTLLNNYQDSLKNYENALNSAGVTEQKFSIYQESINSKLDKATASIEGFWQHAIDSDIIKMSIDAFSGLIDILDILINNSFSQFIIQTGLTSTAIILLGKGITALKKSTLGTAVGVFALDVAEKGLLVTTKALTASLLASPLFWVVAGTTAIYAIIKGVDLLTTSLEEQREIVNTLSTELSNLQSEYDKLKGTDNKTKEQEKYLKLLEKEIELKKQSKLEETKKLVNKEYFTNTASGVDIYSAAQSGNLDFVTDKSGAGKIKNTIDEIKNLREELFNLEEGTEAFKEIESKIGGLKQSLIDIYKNIETYIQTFKDSGEEVPSELLKLSNYIYVVVTAENKQIKTLAELKLAEDTQKQNAISNANANDFQAKTYEELAKSVAETIDKTDDLNNIQSDLAEGNKLSAKSMLEVIGKYPELLDYMKLTEDGYIIEAEGINLVRQSLIDKQITALETESGITNIVRQQTAERLGISLAELETINTLNKAREAAAKLNKNNDSDLGLGAFLIKQDTATLEGIAKINALKDILIKGSKITPPKSSGSSTKTSDSLSDYLPREQELLNYIENAQNKIKDLTNEETQARLDGIKPIEDANKSLISYYKTVRDTLTDKEMIADINSKIIKLEGDNASLAKDRKDLENDIAKAKQKQVDEAEQQRKQQQKDLISDTQKLIELEKSIDQIALDEKEKQLKQDILDLEKEIYGTTKEEYELRSKGIIDSIQDEINALEEKEAIQKEEEERQSRILEIQELQTKLANLKLIQAKELEIYNGKTQEEFEKNIEAQNEALQSQIEALQDKSDLEDEILERQERQLAIQKQQELLNNLNAEKTTRVYREGQGWVWESDQKAVKEAEEQLIDLQTDYNEWEADLETQHQIEQLQSQIDFNNQLVENNRTTLDELRQQLDNATTGIQGEIDELLLQITEKQQAFDAWELENDLARKKEKLEREIEYEQNLLKQKEEDYEKQKEGLETAFKTEEEKFNNHYANIDILVAERLEELRKTNNGKWDSILSDITAKLAEAESKYQKLLGIEKSAEEIAKEISSGNSSGSSITSYSDLTSAQKTAVQEWIKKNGGSADWQMAVSVLGYASGTDSSRRGLSLVGEEGAELRWLDEGTKILPSEISKQILNLPNVMTNFLTNLTPKFSQVNGVGMGGNLPIQNHYHFDNMTVQTNDARGFIKNLMLLANSKS